MSAGVRPLLGATQTDRLDKVAEYLPRSDKGGFHAKPSTKFRYLVQFNQWKEWLPRVRKNTEGVLEGPRVHQ